jgi:hypothetical protein
MLKSRIKDLVSRDSLLEQSKFEIISDSVSIKLVGGVATCSNLTSCGVYTNHDDECGSLTECGQYNKD